MEKVRYITQSHEGSKNCTYVSSTLWVRPWAGTQALVNWAISSGPSLGDIEMSQDQSLALRLS